MVKFFNAVEVTPIWKKQDDSLQYFDITILVQIIGMTSVLWFLFTLLSAAVSKKILLVLQIQPNPILQILSQPVSHIIILPFLQLILIWIINNYSKRYEKIDLGFQWNTYRNDMLNTFDLEEREGMLNFSPVVMFYLLNLSILGLGLVSGLLYTIFLFAPYYFFFFFITLVLSSFSGLNNTILIISMLVTWTFLTRWVLKRKLSRKVEVSELEDNKETKQRYKVTNRTKQIRESQKEPQICPACRSFMPPDETTCSICQEQLN